MSILSTSKDIAAVSSIQLVLFIFVVLESKVFLQGLCLFFMFARSNILDFLALDPRAAACFCSSQEAAGRVPKCLSPD
jgi:hypothetical protein